MEINNTLKCDKCIYSKGYFTGDDEYPARTYIPYCSKGHWEGSDREPIDYTLWEGCIDYKEVEDNE